MTLKTETIATVQALIEGASKTFANAEALYSEATILANCQAWARALVLYQISSEECAKIEMLGATVTSLLMGHAVNVKSLRRAFGRHESKNKTNAYFLPRTEAETSALSAGDTLGVRKAFAGLQDAFHEESNFKKNAALYVDFGDTFRSPLEVVDEPVFQKVRAQNENFMAIAFAKVEMLRRWSIDLEGAASQLAEFQDALGTSALDSGNAKQIKAFHELLDKKLLVEKIREFASKQRLPRSDHF